MQGVENHKVVFHALCTCRPWPGMRLSMAGQGVVHISMTRFSPLAVPSHVWVAWASWPEGFWGRAPAAAARAGGHCMACPGGSFPDVGGFRQPGMCDDIETRC